MSRPLSPAGKLQIIQDLLDETVYDDNGNVIGKKEPVITKEQAMKLLSEDL